MNPFEEPFRALVADLEAQVAAGWMPPSMKAEATRAIRWAYDVLAAVQGEDQSRKEELLEMAAHFDAWLQDYGVFRRLIDTGAVEGDDAAATVTLRWDRVTPEDRKAATSLATELVDAYRGRSAGGWPKGKARN